MSNLRQAAQQALSAMCELQYAVAHDGTIEDVELHHQAIEALRAALAEQQEPVRLTELPPLPLEDVLHDLHDEPCPACNVMLRALPPIKLGYTAAQMREYARAVEAAVLERIGVQR